MTAIITIVQSTRPTTLCKHYAKVGGKVQKTPIANVTQGICTTHAVATTNDMASVLAEITASRDLCIVPGVWRGAGEEPFDLVTEEELCRLTNGVKGDIAGGVHVVGERRLAARLKRGIEPSDWLLLDADNPPGIPDHWASMNMAQRLVMLEPLIPGISKCERIELRGSSARVMNGSGNPGQRTHGWVRVNRPDLIEVMRARVAVDMVNKDLSFKSARYSRQVPGQVIGHERRTVLDLAVWISGRIVFNAQPHLGDGMAAYTVADADITIVNEGGGVLDISAMTVPARPALGEYQARTGVRLQIARNGAAISIVSNGQLTMDTEIESAGTTKPLSVWVQDMRPGDKLRCEAPFRASQSEAAVVILRSDGVPLVHDVGNSTTYNLAGTTDADVLAPDWPEPSRLPDALPAVKPFDPELLPEALRGWIMDISDRMQCPPDFSAVAAVAALSSLIGARAVVCPKARDDWRVVPNLWALPIGRPGVMKSPAIDEAIKPLVRLQLDERKRWHDEVQDWQIDAKVSELAGKAREKTAAKVAEKDPAKARALLARSDDMGDEPQQRRFTVDDATVEALQDILAVNPWGTLAYRDELYGLLTSLDKQGQEGSRAFYLTGYDGNKSYQTDRIIRGKTYIPRVCISVLGGMQPSRVQEYVRAAVAGGAGDDGLLQRFGLAVWPDISGDFRYVDEWPNNAMRQRAWDVFERLSMLQPASDDEPVVWRFSPEAQSIFIEWYTASRRELKAGALHPALESHLSKYAKLVPALALIFAHVDTPEAGGVIHERELLRALAWADYLRTHAERLYAAAVTPETGAARALLSKIQNGRLIDGDGVCLSMFTPRQISTKGWTGLGTPAAVRAAADVLVDFDWLRQEVVRSADERGRGRPSDRYLLNPAAMTAGSRQ